MCKIKVGKDVRTERDVQNLITSVILRQNSDFDREAIVVQFQKKMVDSEVKLKDYQIERKILSTLRTLECSGVIGVKNGVYRKKRMLIG